MKSPKCRLSVFEKRSDFRSVVVKNGSVETVVFLAGISYSLLVAIVNTTNLKSLRVFNVSEIRCFASSTSV